MVSEHNITKPVADPGNTVNEAVVQGKFTFLSGEISYLVRNVRTIGKVTTRNEMGEVSRGRSSRASL